VIRGRRRLHQGVFAALAVVIPSFLIIGILLRPQVPPVADVDRALWRQAGFPSPRTGALRVVDAGTHEFDVQTTVKDKASLIIRPRTVILKPDLAVYWTPQSGASLKLAGDALLIGGLSGTSQRELTLPPAASQGNGTVIIYSVAHQEVVAGFPLRDALNPAASKE